MENGQQRDELQQHWTSLMRQVYSLHYAGEYQEAIVKGETALKLAESLSLEDLVTNLNYLAVLYDEKGDDRKFWEAVVKFETALKLGKSLSPEDLVTNLNNLAVLYDKKGEHSRAESLYLRSLYINERTLGKEHPSIAIILNNLARLYKAKRDPRDFFAPDDLFPSGDPRDFFPPDDLFSSRDSRDFFAQDYPFPSFILNNLARLYEAERDPRDFFADDLFPSGDTRNFLALDYRDPRDLFAFPSFDMMQRALRANSHSVAATLNNPAIFDECRFYNPFDVEEMYLNSLDIYERVLGRDHYHLSIVLHYLAGSYRAQGLYDRALVHHQTALNYQYNFISDRLTHINESEHQLYTEDLKLTLKVLLSLVYLYLKTDQSAIAIALNAVLLTKNLSAAALAARNAVVHSGNPQLKPKIHQIRELTAQSNHLADNDPHQAEIRKQIWAIEIEIARIAPEVMLPDLLEIDRQAIALKLPPDSSLVEFIGFDVIDFDSNSSGSTRYLAFIYSPDRTDEIRLVDLGLASEIDPLIASCRRSILDIYGSVETAASCVPDEIEEFPLESLEPVRTRIIEPLQLEGVSHVIIAPDGALSFLPFQLFLPNCLVSYLNTGRDLVTKPSQKPAGDSIVIADPDFVNKPTELQLVPSKSQIEANGRQVAGIKDLDNWTRLESFGILGRSIAQKLQAPYYKQGKATKARLTQSQCPHILSILTHGFSLPKTDADELDPMARSGLAFAGANHGAEYLLLANEVATLDLHNNELTLLVACQTALGDTITGEGVYGLRRAFALAGAKTLIATLWEIPVYASVILIERFLDNLERTMGKAAALKEAQMYLRDIDVATLARIPNGAGIKALTELHGEKYNLDDAFQPFSHPYFWAAWICQGDTGAMKYVIARDIGRFKIGGKVVNLRIQK